MKISLDQWRVFIAVVESGGFAQAGLALHKTQSTISHTIKKIESALKRDLFVIVGRKSVVTQFGKLLIPKVKKLIGEASNIENICKDFEVNVYEEISIAIDACYPRKKLILILKEFYNEYPEVNVRVYYTTLSRTSELLEDGIVKIGVSSSSPQGVISTPSNNVKMIAITSPDHCIFDNKKTVSIEELTKYIQIVIQDMGIRNNKNSGWLGSQRRLTLSTLDDVRNFLYEPLWFAWLPEWCVKEDLETGKLKEIKLSDCQFRNIYLQCSAYSEGLCCPSTKYLFDLFCHNR